MAARFWVGGTANWDGISVLTWATTSGGAPGATAPGASDDVTFDANSGGGTVTITATQSVLSITEGAHTGTLDFNGQSVTIGTFSITGTGTRTLTFGSSGISITGTGTSWNAATLTNLTVSANTATATMSGSSPTFSSPGFNWNGLSLVITSSGSTTLGAAAATVNTIANLTKTGTAAKTDNLLLTGDWTITNTINVNGNSAINRLYVRSSTLAAARTITAATMSASTNAVDFRDITAAGAANWNLSALSNYSGNVGGNTGITFTTPATQTATGTASFTWSTHGWTSRVPLAQDNVVISNAFIAGRTVTIDMPRLGANIDFSSCTGSPAASLTASGGEWTGNFALATGMTTSGGNNISSTGRGAQTFTSNGVTTSWAIIFTCPGAGSLSLLDALVNSSAGITLGSAGVATAFNTGSFNITMTAATTAVTATNLSVENLGTSLITINRTAAGTFFTSSSGASFTTSTSTIKIGTATANALTFAGGSSRTYGTLDYTLSGSTGALTITGGGNQSFAAINFSDASNARTITFPSAATTVIRTPAGFSGIVGTSGKLMTINASVGGSAATLSISGGTVSSDYLAVIDNTAQGAINFYAGANSTLSNTTNWTNTAPPASTNQALLSLGAGG